MYPELDELGTAKEGSVGALIGTPGLSTLLTLPTSSFRGGFTASNGVPYVVYGNTVYTISVSVGGVYSYTSLGTILTASGPVSMADNGSTLFLVDGTNGWTSTLGSSSITKVTDSGFLGASWVTFQDGYFIFFQPGKRVVFCSDFGATTFQGSGLGTSLQGAKGSYPDALSCVISVNRNLWLIGTQTSECWYNAGNALPAFPFSLIQGAVVKIGSPATFSIQIINNTLFFVGQDENGSGIVYAMSGYQPQRISTHAIELAIQSYGDISGTTSWSYQENGHQFYALNFKNAGGQSVANSTWVFDVTTSLWHERVYLSQGQFQRALPEGHFLFNGIHVVGDYQSGNLYQMSSSVYSDNGAYVPRQRVLPHLAKDMDRIFHRSLQLDLEPGVGIDGSGQGVSPQAMMQFSNDGGHTWSNESWTSVGEIGQTKQRAIWRRLGQARDRVYKVTITDPVKVVMIGAELQVEKGTT